MSYIQYGQATTGGKQLAELMADIQSVATRLPNVKAWIAEIANGDPTNLVSNTDFSVASGQGQAFNDTVVSLSDSFAIWYGNGASDTNSEKIARLARGA